MQLVDISIEARINYEVITTIYHGLRDTSTSIKMSIDGHTLEEVEKAIAKVKEIAETQQEAARAVMVK